MTRLWSIAGETLAPLAPQRLESEDRLERWLEADIGLLNPGLLLIGRQVATPYGGRLDLLAVDADGSLTIIELKRDRTPRDIVAQVLDYASWIARLDTPGVHELAEAYWRVRGGGFVEAFRRKFDTSPPEPLNISHTMVIVASVLDPASQRIVEYLSQTHDVGINTAFFTIFGDGGRQFLSADWLMDQEEVVERTERRARSPWTGLWYVNAGEGEHRSWEDMRHLGFVAAGGGRVYSAPLERLSVGDQIYVYQKGSGYVGYGAVTQTASMVRDFRIDDRPLLDHELVQPNLAHDPDNEEKAEYAVGVRWAKTLPVSQAKTFSGIFANQNVVCKLRDSRTLDFLRQEFDNT